MLTSVNIVFEGTNSPNILTTDEIIIIASKFYFYSLQVLSNLLFDSIEHKRVYRPRLEFNSKFKTTTENYKEDKILKYAVYWVMHI